MNGGAGLYEVRALKSPRTMNGLPVPPLCMPPRKEEKGRRDKGKKGWGKRGGVTLDKFHFPVGKVVGDFTSGTTPKGRRASGCKGVP